MKTLTFALLLALSQAAQQPPASPPPPSAPVWRSLRPARVHRRAAGSAGGRRCRALAELTRDVIVDQDGTFDFPYIGRIAAGGKGVRAIEAEIKDQALADGTC